MRGQERLGAGLRKVTTWSASRDVEEPYSGVDDEAGEPPVGDHRAEAGEPEPGGWHARTGRTDIVLVLAGIALLAVALVLMDRWRVDGFSILELEFAATPLDAARALAPLGAGLFAATPLDKGHLDNLRGQLWADSALFIPGYVLALVGLSGLVRRPGTIRPWAAFSRIASIFAVAAGVLDLIENFALWRVVRTADVAPSASSVATSVPRWATTVASAAATVKFVLVFVAVVYVGFGIVQAIARLAVFLASRQEFSTRVRTWAQHRTIRPWAMPKPVEEDDGGSRSRPAWRDPVDGGEGDGLDQWVPAADRIGIACSGGGVRSAAFNLGALQVLRERGVFANAKYLSAVSGGGYIAAAVSYADANAGAGAEPWAPLSAEERHFRNHSSYIAPKARDKAGALLRVLVGLSFNFALIWLCLFLVARPLGWIVSTVHPELRARLPVVEVDEQLNVERRAIVSEGNAVTIDLGRESIPLTVDGPSGKAEIEAPVRVIPGRIVGRTNDWRIVEQPRIVVDDPFDGCPEAGDACLDVQNKADDPYVRVKENVELRIRSAPDRDGRPVFAVANQPEIDAISGTKGRPHLGVEGWMWWLIAVPAAFALVTAVIGMLLRTKRGDSTYGRIAMTAITFAAGTFLVLVALPWAVQDIPPWVADQVDRLPDGVRSTSDAGATAIPALAAAGYLGMLFAAARGLFARQPKVFAGALATVFVVLTIALSLIAFMVYAAASGPWGQFTGFDRGWWGPPDIVKAAIVALGLALIVVVADVNAWSLHTFYKQRLQSAYLLLRRGDAVEPMPFEDLVGLDEVVHDGSPELVLCAAANVSDEGATPPGRNSVSFTFSGTEIGGPEVGWIKTTLMYDRLGRTRERDVTLPAAMAISGAAISPAMGKKSMFGFAPLLAMLNVRLGVWVPNPRWVRGQGEGFVWRDKPRAHHLAMEIFGVYPREHTYVYVTDGGHWDNLGLVELLRRGCTEIYCFDASGDHVDTFFTIGEAVALARAELGVEIDIRPDVMRPPLEAPKEGRLLRRRRRKQLVDGACAPFNYAYGTIKYPGDDPIFGRLVIGKAAVTDDVPWDVFAFAEKQPNFPTHSTLDQLYTDEKFEAYRSLGRNVAEHAYATMGAKQWVLVVLPAVTGFDPTSVANALMQKIASDGYGTFEGTHAVEDAAEISASAPDANRLYHVVATMLAELPLPAGSYAVKRYGPNTAQQIRMPLG